jgi:hypothetical protein
MRADRDVGRYLIEVELRSLGVGEGQRQRRAGPAQMAPNK